MKCKLFGDKVRFYSSPMLTKLVIDLRKRRLVISVDHRLEILQDRRFELRILYMRWSDKLY